MAELHDLTAVQQAAAIRTGEISPVELTRHYLARIERLDPELGAFITVTPESALERAQAAERIAREHRPDPAALPPLHGVPVAIKDLAETAGVRTTFGSRAFRDYVPDADAHVVTALRAAGTISVGKTSTPEFGMCPYTDNDLVGPARNPWDTRYSAGGSSGGAGAAVAAGLVPFAHGSDGGGSIRIPASACGLVGLKPSRGRISTGPFAHVLAVEGALARDVRDAAALLDAMAGPMPGDPYYAPPLPAGQTFLGQAGREPGRLRIGRYAIAASRAEIDPVCVAAWRDASDLLAGLGHEVVDIDVPFGPEIADHFVVVWAVKSLDQQVPDEDLLRPITRSWRAHGRTISGAAYANAIRGMQVAAHRAITATAEFDAVLTPTLGVPAQLAEFFAEDGDPMVNLRRQALVTPFTTAYKMTGQPVFSLPLGRDTSGLPVGVALAGLPFGEAGLITLAAQIEAARPWAGRHPDCW